MDRLCSDSFAVRQRVSLEHCGTRRRHESARALVAPSFYSGVLCPLTISNSRSCFRRMCIDTPCLSRLTIFDDLAQESITLCCNSLRAVSWMIVNTRTFRFLRSLPVLGRGAYWMTTSTYTCLAARTMTCDTCSPRSAHAHSAPIPRSPSSDSGWHTILTRIGIVTPGEKGPAP